jgi:glycerol dehydrogenase
LITTTVFPGSYVQGAGARKLLGKELQRFGQKGLIIFDPFVYENILPEFESYLSQVGVDIVSFSGECCD